MGTTTAERTYNTGEALRWAGLTLRTLSHWARNGVLASTSGETERPLRWTATELRMLRLLRMLSDLNCPVERLREARRKIESTPGFFRLAEHDYLTVPLGDHSPYVQRGPKVSVSGTEWIVPLYPCLYPVPT